MNQPSKLSTAKILDKNLERKAPLHMQNFRLVLHNIRSMHNVGSAFRSADAFGIKEIILSGYTPRPPRPEISKTAIGAEEFVAWQAFDTLEDVLQAFPKQSYSYVGLEQTSNSVPIQNLALPSKDICLFCGNEVMGIDEQLLPHIDHFVEIEQYGQKHSLNVSVALGVSLYAFMVKSL